MGMTLTDIAQMLKDAKHKNKSKDKSLSDVKVKLIYAFNGTGKTRLSRELKLLVKTIIDRDT